MTGCLKPQSKHVESATASWRPCTVQSQQYDLYIFLQSECQSLRMDRKFYCAFETDLFILFLGWIKMSVFRSVPGMLRVNDIDLGGPP